MSVAIELESGGAIARLVLENGKGNVLDAAAVASLSRALGEVAGARELRAVLLDHGGPDFSYGASVAEHLPGAVERMLPELDGLILQLVSFEVPTIACVRGRCLGGGLELALACTRIVAAPGACFGQPELRLGVFAPAASLLLPPRIGEAAAATLLLHGSTVDAGAAAALGLVDELASEPLEAARTWARPLLGLSASSLRFAHRALATRRRDAFAPRLARLERLYLEELMSTGDAREGLEAFLAKRAPEWRNG